VVDEHHTHEADRGGKRPRDRERDFARSPHVSALLTELREHVPFSVSAVAIGLIVAGAICVLGFDDPGLPDAGADLDHDHVHAPGPARLLFHLFHPAHMLFSATATTAMFFRYERKTAKAIVIGLIGAIGVCGVSDIAMPHVSLFVLGAQTPWHICVYEHPMLVLPFAVVGVLVGVAATSGVMHSTLISHSLHVLASTMASIFYMVGPLGVILWIDQIGKVFFFVVLAVTVPCCLSDIVFPLLMSRRSREVYLHDGHTH
jgi:hypothetical protein